MCPYLFINPPVEDFSCSDYYSMPYGMLNLMRDFANAKTPFSFYDFLNEGFASDKEVYRYRKNGTGDYPWQVIEKPRAFHQIPRKFRRYGNTIKSFENYLENHQIKLEKAFLLINTDFTYRADGVIKFIKELKENFGVQFQNVMLGGTASILMPEYFQERLPRVQIYTRDFDLKTTDPILSEKHSDLFYLDSYETLKYIPIRLSRFCPDDCSYCASRYIRESSQIIDRRILSKTQTKAVRDYLVKYTSRFKTSISIPIDDAFLLSLKIIPEIFEGLNLSMSTPNGLHLRYINPRSAEILYRSGFKELRFGVECLSGTAAMEAGVKIGGDNIREKIADVLNAGFLKSQVHFYLLYGLKGQKYNDVINTINIIKETGCKINISGYSPVPHSRMFKSLDSNLEHLLSENPCITNNNTVSLWNPEFSEERINMIKIMAQ